MRMKNGWRLFKKPFPIIHNTTNMVLTFQINHIFLLVCSRCCSVRTLHCVTRCFYGATRCAQSTFIHSSTASSNKIQIMCVIRGGAFTHTHKRHSRMAPTRQIANKKTFSPICRRENAYAINTNATTATAEEKKIGKLSSLGDGNIWMTIRNWKWKVRSNNNRKKSSLYPCVHTAQCTALVTASDWWQKIWPPLFESLLNGNRNRWMAAGGGETKKFSTAFFVTKVARMRLLVVSRMHDSLRCAICLWRKSGLDLNCRRWLYKHPARRARENGTTKK